VDKVNIFVARTKCIEKENTRVFCCLCVRNLSLCVRKKLLSLFFFSKRAAPLFCAKKRHSSSPARTNESLISLYLISSSLGNPRTRFLFTFYITHTHTHTHNKNVLLRCQHHSSLARDLRQADDVFQERRVASRRQR
jgi:hypothetical protein